jgi:hypothetical protein
MNTKMKISICHYLIATLPLDSLHMQAQSTPTYGFKGGLNVSNFYVEDIDDKNARLGFHAGLYGQLFSTGFFALQPEINFSTRGNEVISDGVFDQKTRFNLNYIDVPVLAVFKLGDKLEFHAGVYGAYLVGAGIKSEGDLGDWFDELDRDNFESFDYGLSGGIGLNFGALQVGARYNLGLAQIAKTDQARVVLGDSKNSLGQLYVAFRLNKQ